MRGTRAVGLWIGVAVLLIAAIVLAALSRQVSSYGALMWIFGLICLLAAVALGVVAYRRRSSGRE